MKNTILFFAIIFMANNLVGQSKEDLEKDLEACECFLSAMKKHSNVNDKFWEIEGVFVDRGGPKAKSGEQPKQIWHECGSAGPPQGLYTHQQVVNNIKNTKPKCDKIRNELNSLRNGTNKKEPSSENREVSEAEKFQQSMRNIQNVAMMLQESRDRAAQVARDLQQFNDVGNSNDPFEIMNRYNYNVQRIDEINEAFKESATIGNINNVTQVASDYASGNDEGAFYGGIGALGAMLENQEAKKKIEAKKQALEQKKYDAMLRSAKSLIKANIEAQNKWLEAASKALEEDKETYYMEQAIYHGSFVNYINSNFSSSNTEWAKNPFKKPEKSDFQKERGNLAELHFKSAKRKQKLYQKYSNNEILYEGIIMHLSAAIDEDPNNYKYYLELGKITNPSDLVLSLQSYLTAYELNSNGFTLENKIEYNKLKELVSQDIAKALRNQNESRLREYIDAGLYSVLRVNNQTPWEIAMKKDYEKIASLIYHEEIPNWKKNKQQEKIQKGILIASQFGSMKSLNLLKKEGVSLEFERDNKTPLAVAAEHEQIETFRYLLFNSDNRNLSQQPFNNSAILISALINEYPEEATDQLCGIKKQDNLEKTLRKVLTTTNKFSTSAIEKYFLAKVICNCSLSKKAVIETTEFQSIIQDYFMSALSLQVRQLSDAETAIYYIKQGLISEDFLNANKSQLTVKSIENDNYKVLKWLQENNYDVSEDNKGLPIAHHFVVQPKNIIKLGLYKKYSFNKKDKDGVPFIHKLIFTKNSSTFLRVLVRENLIDINQEGLYGWTALHYAARENKTYLVQRLVALGANKKAKDQWGRSPFKIAKERDYKQLKAVLK